MRRTLDAVYEANIADAVVVTTDDEEIANVACAAGALVLPRAPGLADDHTPVLPVVQSAIRQLPDIDISVNEDDRIGLVYATAIAMSPTDLAASYASIPDDRFVVSVCSYNHPPQRGFTLGPDDSLQPVAPSKSQARTQDLDEWFHDAAQFVWAQARTWESSDEIFSRGVGHRVARWRAIDIDTAEDLHMAEVLLAGIASLSPGSGT